MSLNITADSQYYAGTASPAFNASGLANFSFGIWVKRTNTALSEMYAEIGRAIGDEHDMVALGDGGTVEVGTAFLCGAQALGAAYAKRWRSVEETFDYGDKHGVGIDSIYGIEKMKFGTASGSDTGDLKDHGVVTGYFATSN